MDKCIVCRGERRIRLPLFHQMTGRAFSADVDLSIGETSRDYPCPECGPQIGVERLMCFSSIGFASKEIDDPRYKERVRVNMVHEMINGLLERGAIKFDERPGISGIEIRATMTVAMDGVETIEERTTAHQTIIADAACTDAVHAIEKWESYQHGRDVITKSLAVALVQQATGKAVAVYKEWKRVSITRSTATSAPVACEYCGPGVRTGLPGNACENCMNTGLKNPQPSAVSRDGETLADELTRLVDEWRSGEGSEREEAWNLVADFTCCNWWKLVNALNAQASTLTPSDAMTTQYLIWSHEHGCWWRPNSAGYTKDPRAAGIYSREEALSISWRGP